MPKKTQPETTLAVAAPAAQNLTSGFETGLALYENTACAIVPAYSQMLRSGTAFVMQRLKIGYHLAQLRATEKGALKTFCKLAMAGQVGGGMKMTKYHLETSLATFDQCCKDLGYGKKDVLQLEAEHKLKEVQMELWQEAPPETADALLRAMHQWAQDKGLKTAHEAIMQQPATPPPPGGGDDPTPSDPAKLAQEAAQDMMTTLVTHFETDLFAQAQDGSFADHTDKKLKDHPCSWSLLPMDDPDGRTLNNLHLLLERWHASTTRLLQLKAGTGPKRKAK